MRGGRFLRFTSITPPQVRVLACDTRHAKVIEVKGKRYRATVHTDDGMTVVGWSDRDEIKDGE